MGKREFIRILVSSFGYSNVEIKRYCSGTNDGQSTNVGIWDVRAFKKDARGDRHIHFQEATFDRFINGLSRKLCQID